MATIPVDSWLIGAGDIYLDGVVIGSTRENNVFRLARELDATIANGIGMKLARTDYYVRKPYPVLEFTYIELSESSLPLVVPAALVETVGDDIEISDPSRRRLTGDDYHEWALRVPGVDGLDVEFVIPIGINVNDAEFTAADSPDPLGPRMMIEGRGNPDDTTAKTWIIRLIGGALS